MFDFGNHLRMLREKHGISQEELGRRVGRAGSVISNYENNIKIPTLDVLTTMARIYDVSLDYLVGFDKKDQVLLPADEPNRAAHPSYPLKAPDPFYHPRLPSPI